MSDHSRSFSNLDPVEIAIWAASGAIAAIPAQWNRVEKKRKAMCEEYAATSGNQKLGIFQADTSEVILFVAAGMDHCLSSWCGTKTRQDSNLNQKKSFGLQ